MKLRTPAGLRARGRRFWADTTTAFELERDEVELLVEVCRTLDTIDSLQVAVDREGVVVPGSTGQPRQHPALTELRGARIVLSRLLAQLALPDAEGAPLATATSDRARSAAQARWARRPAVRRGA